VNRRDPDVEPDLSAELAARQRGRMLLVRDAWQRSSGVARRNWAGSLLWFSEVDGCGDVLTDDELAEIRQLLTR